MGFKIHKSLNKHFQKNKVLKGQFRRDEIFLPVETLGITESRNRSYVSIKYKAVNPKVTEIINKRRYIGDYKRQLGFHKMDIAIKCKDRILYEETGVTLQRIISLLADDFKVLKSIVIPAMYLEE